ncbi:hypothetical protein CAEBREN_08516 [Caenorhabditis brenneri]|uniref:SCP domain-containing protein n=1 Tax=Caenorhabditis brenneri TaxID=135651 RepID=G0NPJ2_CAEBE|nr:hypothetical protein CAEBREN_08516 [Caenorhabditis brenneri]
MKALTIFFFASCVISEPFIDSCGEHYYEFPKRKNDPERMVDHFNGYRRRFMKDCQVSNMHELKYDKGLEEEIRKMKSCKDVVHGPNYRVQMMVDWKGREVIHKVIEKRIKDQLAFTKKNPDLLGVWLESPEEFHPTQTSIAWCDVNEKCWDTLVDVRNKSTPWQIRRIVAFGQKGTYDESDFKYGEPGTDCSKGTVGPITMLCKGSEDNRVVSILGGILIFWINFVISFV